MRTMFGLVLLIGLALAGTAVYMAKGYISKQEIEAQQANLIFERTGGLVEVFVVNKPKNYGDTLTKEDVQMIYWPQNALPEGVFLDPAVLFPEDNATPRYVTREMETFEPVLAVKVTEPGEQAGLNGEIEQGMRAFAIKVEAADFLQPGDRVDIYWTGSVQGTTGEMTRLIESTMKIIAVDRRKAGGVSDGEIQSRSMTVAATPEQVARLAQAQATGRLVMSLVGTGDQIASGAIEIDSNALLGIEAQQPVAVEDAPKTCTIRTRKGADVVEIPIPCTN
jgi:pilus assembly protein CpaB